MIGLLQSPSALILILAVLLIVTIQIIGDIKEARLHARAKKMQSLAKSPPRFLVSVLVEVTNESVFSTLESLEENEYKHLEVILIMKSRSKKLLSKVKAYQRKSLFKKTRVITARNGLNQVQLLQKYSTGSIVMSLESGDLVVQKFIAQNVVHFKDTKLQAIVANSGMPTSNSLVLALDAVRRNLAGYLRRIFVPQTVSTDRLKKSILYRKNATTHEHKQPRVLQAVYVNSIFVTEQRYQKQNAKKISLFAYLPVLLICCSLALIGIVENYAQALFTLRVLGVLGIVLGLLSWQQGGVSKYTTKLSFALLTPFAILLPHIELKFLKAPKKYL